MFFQFDEGSKTTEYTVCGDYLCWRSINSTIVNYAYMNDIEENNNINDLNGYVKSIDLEEHHRGDSEYTISINTLSGLHAIHAFPSREITIEMIRQSRNSLQVIFTNRSVIY